MRLPKGTDAEKKARQEAMDAATKYAILTPFRVMKASLKSMDIIQKMAEIGNPNSITDACVAALCARTAIRGAFLNVKINCLDCNDKAFIKKIEKDGDKILNKALKLEDDIIEITNKVMDS